MLAWGGDRRGGQMGEGWRQVWGGQMGGQHQTLIVPHLCSHPLVLQPPGDWMQNSVGLRIVTTQSSEFICNVPKIKSFSCVTYVKFT